MTKTRIRSKTVVLWTDLIKFLSVPRSMREISDRYHLQPHNVYDNINRMIAYGLPVSITKVRHQGYGNTRFALTVTEKEARSVFHALTTPKAPKPVAVPQERRAMRKRIAPWFVMTVECEKYYA